EDTVAKRTLGGLQHRPELGIGARRGAQLHRDLEERAREALPEQLDHRIRARGAVPLLRELPRELLELARAHLREVIDGGDQELGLGREVMEQRSSRDIGAALDLERRGPREPDLDQALDDGVEQRAPGLVTALLLGARSSGAAGLRPLTRAA